MATEGRMPPLTEVCWPVFEFVTNFARQVKYGMVPAPEQVRYDGLSALRDADELAREDPVTERLWHDWVKAMMVYLVDYKMLNTEWDGRDYWFDNRFETDRTVLDHVEALGGEKFFDDCDKVQQEYELAERRDRRDKEELAALLNCYFICLRLGFRGRFHEYPQELADYTRRLFTRLPAYSKTRGKEMFPDAYQHNQELKVDYKLGLSLSIVLTIFVVILVASAFAFRQAWSNAVGEIRRQAERWGQVTAVAPPAPADQNAAKDAATR
ncbi:MAG: DotU family type IV/VI secretion system protein [Phycisphaerae bacterium]|nr:DotU family type IV/VI secretion system protein [Phycisphaerae bacterium]